MARVLVGLHELGATSEQLAASYQNMLAETQSMHGLPIRSINEQNWDQYLGKSSYYEEYLVFFDQQLALLGLSKTLETYYYSIPYSIGSQLQPMVHLCFGIDQNMPEIITQALAYHASTYLDVSTLLEDSHVNLKESKGLHQMNSILFDLIGSDARFDGKIEGCVPFDSAVKILLESKADLIKTYLHLWNQTPMSIQQRIDALLMTAVQLIKHSTRQDTMDWFLSGGQLADATMAIHNMIHPEHIETWLNLQFISTVCTYIVQGRPKPSLIPASLSWKSCLTAVLQSADPKTVLAFVSILKVRLYYPHTLSESSYLEITNILAQFTLHGTWVKSGLGWI